MGVTVINRAWQLLTEQQMMGVTVINRATEDGSHSY